MSGPAVITATGLGKRYRLGLIGSGTLREDLDRAWARMRGRRAESGSAPRGAAGPAAEALWALRDVGFSMGQGETLGIVGRNGAGKSTLLKILARITAPTTGEARLRGRVGALLAVGTGFHPELTGRENIYLNGTILGMSRAEVRSRLDEIVAFSELEEFIDTPVKRYSPGMSVRLAFAVAAHLEPEILIVDEVLAVGDAAFRRKCLGKLGDATRDGRAVLFVSHNLAAVSHLCRRALWLEDGRLLQDGEADAVVTAYLEASLGGEPGSARADRANSEALRRVAGARPLSIAAVSLEGADSEAGRIRTGGELRLHIEYDCEGEPRAPSFIVQFRSFQGVEVLRLSTQPISGFDPGPLHRRGVLTLTIPELPLVAGAYTIDVGCLRSNLDWMLRLPALLTVDVQPHDCYGSGDALDSSQGLLVVPHRWSHDAA